MNGLHHLHLRKRISQPVVCEPYPARSPSLRFLDRFMIFVAFCSPLALLPQVVETYLTHAVNGLSIASWGFLTIINIFWSLYGFVHRDLPIIISSVLVALIDAAIVIAILVFAS